MCSEQHGLFFFQQIDDILAGGFSQDDEDAILAELDAITQVRKIHLFKLFSGYHMKVAILSPQSLFCSYFHYIESLC